MLSIDGTDCRQAWRRTSRAPGSAALASGLMAVAIGLFTTMFSAVDSMLLRPVPFEDAHHLVQQTFWRPEPAVMAAWTASGLFTGVEAASVATFAVDDTPGASWPGAYLTAGMFELLKVAPLRGRTFVSPAAGMPAPDEVILSEGIWRSAFGGEPGILGRHLRLGAQSVTVVGIMPGTFRFPTPATVAWKPLELARAEQPVTIYGRATAAASWPEIRGVTAAIAARHAHLPVRYRDVPPISRVAAAEFSAHTRRALWLLLGGVALVFLVLSANVCTLLLSRLAVRQRELATCVALGAPRSRLLAQIALEHLLIGLAGIVGGIAMAHAMTSAFPALFLNRTLNVVDIDGPALLAATGAGLAAILLSGLVPAWLVTRHAAVEALRGGRSAGTRPPARRAAHALLVTQIALASALLIGSTLLLRSFVNIMHADRGLDVEGVQRVSIANFDAAFAEGRTAADALMLIEDGVSRWPEVETSALSREIPPLAQGAGGAARAEGLDGYRVSGTFFSLYRIPLLRGRSFDRGEPDLTVILGERLAAQLWPAGDAVGRTFVWPGMAPRQVIGVAREIRLPALDPALDRPEFYLPLGSTSRTLYLNLRCRIRCPDAGTVAERVRQLHPALAARVVAPGEEVYERQLRLPQAIAQVSGVFATVAVLTVAGGLFSVLSYTARRRRREFGIRQALGASPGQMRRLIVRAGMRIVGTGMLFGAAGGWMVTRLLASFHYGVTFGDPMTWFGVIGVMALTSLVAMWGPSREAANVNPIMLLREE